MIMLGFMETEKEFIKNWEKYRGAAGCLRYLACWFLLGIIVIPLMLTVINPDIWSTVRMDQLAEEAVVFFGFGFWFCILRVIGHFVLVFIPMKLDIVWFHRYFIFFLKR